MNTIFSSTVYGTDAGVKIDRMIAKLNGKTFYTFAVYYGIIPGGFRVAIDAKCTEEEKIDALGMVIAVLADL
jgi:hypothetical protein